MAKPSYENEQKKLEELWDSMMSDEEPSLYGDVYESDEYQPSDSSSSLSSVEYLPQKRRKKEPEEQQAGPSGYQKTKTIVEGEDDNDDWPKQIPDNVSFYFYFHFF